MEKIVKMLIDFTASALALIMLSPFLVLIAVAIKLDSTGPVLFIQERSGREGKSFNICKFRTMVIGAEKKGAGVFVEENDSRITRIGRFLRHTSLDELPQLINILKGEMSLVGPRPTLPYQVERYDERQRGRLKFKPGVTGWAQVNGRSSLTWPERIELDLWYIENWSLLLDIKILIRTIAVALGRGDLYKATGYDPISGAPKKTDRDEDNES